MWKEHRVLIKTGKELNNEYSDAIGLGFGNDRQLETSILRFSFVLQNVVNAKL